MPFRSGHQTPLNMWDTFMISPLDWDKDMFSDEGLFTSHDLQIPGSKEEALAMGAKAYRSSCWHWDPSPADSTNANESYLALLSDMENPCDDAPKGESGTGTGTLKPSDRERIMDLLMTYCDRKNAIRILSSFPPPNFLRRLMHRSFLCLSTQTVAFIHAATFHPERASTELLAAIIAYGACSTSILAIQRLGYAMLEIVRRAITTKWEQDNSTTRDVHLRQAYLLMLSGWLWSGNSHKIEIAEAFLQPITTAMRRSNLFRGECYKDISPSEMDTEADLHRK